MSLKNLLRRALGRGDDAARAAPPEAPAPSERSAAPAADHQLILYKFDSCPYCRRVMRDIDDLGVDVEYRDTRQERKWRAELSERTGRTQVPCLFIDGQPMFESADISAWLRANYG